MRIRYYTHLSPPIDRERFNGVGCSVNFDHIIDPIKLDPTRCPNNRHDCRPVFTTTVFVSFLFFFLLMNSLCVQQQTTIATVGGSDNENGHK
jgi:hypothetical protein